VNDWSGRDIQAWENQPLGPFLGKSFATTVSPWVVSLDALEPFRVALAPRDEGDPVPLPYLESPAPFMPAIDLKLAVHLSTRAMRERSVPPVQLSLVNFRDMYWSGRSDRQRHGLRFGGGDAGFAAGDDAPRNCSAAASGRGGSGISRRWRRDYPQRLLRAGRIASDRFRGVPRQDCSGVRLIFV
jgi:fumarylacetoacetase